MSKSDERRMTVAECAELMNVTPQFIRVGLQRGKLPFGYAVSIGGNRYTYWISPKLFTETTGIEIEKNNKKG